MDSEDATYWCVGLHSASKTLDEARPETSDVREPLKIPEHPGERSNPRVQEAVLADAVQVVQDPQRVRPEVVASLVRLQPLDDCLRAWVPSLGLGQSAAGGREADADGSLPMLIPEDGEFRAAGEFMRKRLAEGSREEAPEEPERAPQREPDPEPQPDPEPSGGGCDPGYSGCVPPFPPDINCPDVNGPVTVTGSDPHGLDRDGDGVACE
jgi:hypothetical protein